MKKREKSSSKAAVRFAAAVDDEDPRPQAPSPYPYAARKTPYPYLEIKENKEIMRKERASSKIAARFAAVLDDEEPRPQAPTPYPTAERKTPFPKPEKDDRKEMMKKERASSKIAARFAAVLDDEEPRPQAPTPYPTTEKKSTVPEPEKDDCKEMMKKERASSKIAARFAAVLDDEEPRPQAPTPYPTAERKTPFPKLEKDECKEMRPKGRPSSRIAARFAAYLEDEEPPAPLAPIPNPYGERKTMSSDSNLEKAKHEESSHKDGNQIDNGSRSYPAINKVPSRADVVNIASQSPVVQKTPRTMFIQVVPHPSDARLPLHPRKTSHTPHPPPSARLKVTDFVPQQPVETKLKIINVAPYPETKLKRADVVPHPPAETKPTSADVVPHPPAKAKENISDVVPQPSVEARPKHADLVPQLKAETRPTFTDVASHSPIDGMPVETMTKITDFAHQPPVEARPKVTDFVPKPSVEAKPKVADFVQQPSVEGRPKVTDFVPHPMVEAMPKITDFVPTPSVKAKQKVSDFVPQPSVEAKPKVSEFEPRQPTDAKPNNTGIKPHRPVEPMIKITDAVPKPSMEARPKITDAVPHPPKEVKPKFTDIAPKPPSAPHQAVRSHMRQRPPETHPTRHMEVVPKMDLSFITLETVKEEDESDSMENSPPRYSYSVHNNVNPNSDNANSGLEGPADRSRRFGMTYLEKAYGRPGFHLPDIKDNDAPVGRNIIKSKTEKLPLINLDLTENNGAEKLEVKLPAMISKARKPMRATETYSGQTRHPTWTYNQVSPRSTRKTTVETLPALSQQTALTYQSVPPGPPKAPPGPSKNRPGQPRATTIEKLRVLTQQQPPSSQRGMSPRPPKPVNEPVPCPPQQTATRPWNTASNEQKIMRETKAANDEQRIGMKQQQTQARWSPRANKPPSAKPVPQWVPVTMSPRRRKTSVVAPLPRIATDPSPAGSPREDGDREYIPRAQAILTTNPNEHLRMNTDFDDAPIERYERDGSILTGLEDIHFSPSELSYITTPSPEKTPRTPGDGEDEETDIKKLGLSIIQQINEMKAERANRNKSHDVKTEYTVTTTTSTVKKAEWDDFVTDPWKEEENRKFREHIIKDTVPHKPKPPHHLKNTFVTGPTSVNVTRGETRQAPSSLRKRRQPRFKKDN